MDKNIKKILIIRYGAIGDLVHSSELFRSIKRSHPDIKIHYLTTKTPSLIINNDEDIEKAWIANGKSYKYLMGLAKELRQEKFDLVINLQPSLRMKFLALLTGSKHNLIYKKTFKLHAVENFWKTACPIFKDIKLSNELTLHLPNIENPKINDLINQNKPIIAFNMGTSNTRQGRRWPIEYWKKLTELLLHKYDCKIIAPGSKEDESLAQELIKDFPSVISFCGELSILESAQLLSKCALVISGDTGPLHIATAVKTRCIGIYGAAPISRTGPYGPNHFALSSERKCVPCNKRKCKYVSKGEVEPCILDIKPESLFELINSHELIK